MTSTKRQNFNISSEQEAEIAQLKKMIGALTTKDAILSAVRVLALLANEFKQGRQVFISEGHSERMTRLVIPELETVKILQYKYLVERPHPWRRQLYVKGRRLLASTVWSDMLVNNMTAEYAAKNWDLPLEAIQECVSYCEKNKELLKMEADEERRQLAEEGIGIESSPVA